MLRKMLATASILGARAVKRTDPDAERFNEGERAHLSRNNDVGRSPKGVSLAAGRI
jgi:hypothetical protein